MVLYSDDSYWTSATASASLCCLPSCLLFPLIHIHSSTFLLHLLEPDASVWYFTNASIALSIHCLFCECIHNHTAQLDKSLSCRYFWYKLASLLCAWSSLVCSRNLTGENFGNTIYSWFRENVAPQKIPAIIMVYMMAQTLAFGWNLN